VIADLKPYPEYKESGLPWLGQVPGHWDVPPLAGLAWMKSVVNQSERQLLSVYLQRGVVRFADVDEKRTNATSKDLSNYQAVDPGDFVLNNQQAWRGSVGVSEYSGIVSPAYLVLALSKRYSARYANLLFRDQSMVSQYLVCSKGVGTIQRNLYWPHLKRVGVVIPPPDEQAAIVRFLDWANGRLERAIRAKRKVIALLNEQKQAIIHRAVTRGLDPSVPLKPSGIPWLGDIPQHWEVTALRRHWRVTDCKHLTVPFVDDGIPLASVVEVQKFSLDLSRCKRTKPEWYRLLIDGDRKPRRGDLIYCRNASVGACALVETDIDFAMGQDVCLIRSRAQNQRFLNYLLHSPFMDHQLELLLVGSTFKRINVSEIKALAVAVPPRHEQNAICESLDAGMVAYDIAISRLAREIEFLREYRTRLVADVVTGKLDVREAAALLPDDAPPDTAEDGTDLSDELELADEETVV